MEYLCHHKLNLAWNLIHLTSTNGEVSNKPAKEALVVLGHSDLIEKYYRILKLRDAISLVLSTVNLL